jgi:hypothetical protein
MHAFSKCIFGQNCPARVFISFEEQYKIEQHKNQMKTIKWKFTVQQTQNQTRNAKTMHSERNGTKNHDSDTGSETDALPVFQSVVEFPNDPVITTIISMSISPDIRVTMLHSQIHFHIRKASRNMERIPGNERKSALFLLRPSYPSKHSSYSTQTPPPDFPTLLYVMYE